MKLFDIIIVCLLFLFTVIFNLIFGFKKKTWVKNNKWLFIFFILSQIAIVGNYLPEYIKDTDKYYDILTGIAYSFIAAFIFYWVITCRKERNLEIYYCYNNVRFFAEGIYKLFGEIVFRREYKICEKGDGHSFTINLPIEEVISFVDENLKSISMEMQQELQVRINKKFINRDLKNKGKSHKDFLEEDCNFKNYIKMCVEARNYKKNIDAQAVVFNIEDVKEFFLLFFYFEGFNLIQNSEEDKHLQQIAHYKNFLNNYKCNQKRIKKVLNNYISRLLKGKNIFLQFH